MCTDYFDNEEDEDGIVDGGEDEDRGTKMKMKRAARKLFPTRDLVWAVT